MNLPPSTINQLIQLMLVVSIINKFVFSLQIHKWVSLKIYPLEQLVAFV